MFTYEKFMPEHIFQMDLCNMDPFTENFTLDYYLNHMIQNRNVAFYCCTMYSEPNKELKMCNSLVEQNKMVYGYVLNYSLSKRLDCTNKISKKYHEKLKLNGFQMFALSVSFLCRKSGVGSQLIFLMDSMDVDFIKLFVRESNKKAINFYIKHNFMVKRRILKYYGEPKENAYEMIKSKTYEIKEEKDIDAYYLSDNSE